MRLKPTRITSETSDAQKLILIKTLHTLVWIFFVSLIFYIVYSGITDRITTFTWISVAFVIAEGLVLLVFRMFCPLTIVARRYSDSTKANFDIYLPNWLAKYNKEIFTTIFVAGLLLVILRTIN